MARTALILSAGLVLAGLAAAGLALAQPSDVIGELLQPPPRAEEPPPAPGEVPSAVAPAPPPPSATPDVAPAAAPAPKVATPTVKAQPGKRTRYPVAILQALDKVTAQSLRFEARVNEPIRHKNLIFTVRSCEVTASDELERDAIAYVEIDSQPRPPAGRVPPPAKAVFRGWLFAASPSVNPVQHPVYDAWLIACKA